VNSSLYGKNIQIPDKVLEYLETCFDQVQNSDPSIEGHKRNEELRNTGYATYQQLGRIKHWFDNYEGDKTDAPFILNGADYMSSWVNNTIDHLRKNDNFDNEIENEYMPADVDDVLLDKLGPLADMVRPSKEHSTFSQDIRIKEDLDRINQIIKQII
jgi:hypothetical protein